VVCLRLVRGRIQSPRPFSVGAIVPLRSLVEVATQAKTEFGQERGIADNGREGLHRVRVEVS
jgi:hypothetical protein